MGVASEIRETANRLAEYLNEQEQIVVLTVMRKFLPPDNVATEEDLHYIKIGEQEILDGNTGSWDNIDWN
ncbi:MAG: hypothetical protein FWD97_01995 [Defluviitaleaceae bacterium]|nr:hypothetical protein [Defluviitaleaceae bacterium]